MDGARNDEDLPRPPKNPPAIHNRRRRLHHQAQPPLQCPRCDSFNTKFCYFNNYSFSQPRYFCKACRRYWTHGGTLRTIPIGGGCRKNKRPRITAPPPPPPSLSSLSSNLINPIITQGLSTNMFSGQSSRPVLPSLGGSFYSDGSYVSTLAAMQSLPTGINQGAAMMGGGGRFLQGMTFPTLKSHVPPHQHLPPPSLSRFFPPQQSLVPPAGRFSSWAQSVINAGAASSSAAANSGLWSGGDGSAASAGEPVDPSFGSNQWPDNLGFNPSQ